MPRKNWNQIKHKSSPEQRARAREELEEQLSLAELRKALELTQAQLADALDMTQPGISRVEKQTDLFVSTLRSYIEALGGQLHVTAVFDDHEIQIARFGSADRPRIEVEEGEAASVGRIARRLGVEVEEPTTA
jgi:transcriptional regulator with XRE-family HTH domain